MTSTKSTDVKELEEKIYEMQKEKNRMIDSYELQLNEAKHRENKLGETISQLRKNNGELRDWIRSTGLECELNLQSENDELSTNDDSINNNPHFVEPSDDDKCESNNLLNSKTELLSESNSNESKSVEKENYFQNEIKRLLNEIQDKEENYLNLKNQWKNVLTTQSHFAMLPTFDKFLGSRWELSFKALPDFLLDAILPTTAMSINSMIPLPLMIVPASANEPGFLFRLYVKNQTELHISYRTITDSYCIQNVGKRILSLMIYSDCEPLQSLSQNLYSYQSKPSLLMSIPKYSFNPTTGLIIAVR